MISFLVQKLRLITRNYHSLIQEMDQPLESLKDAPEIFSVYRRLMADDRVVRKPGGWLYKGKFYPDYLTVGGTSHAIFRTALKYCQGRGLDIGAGFWPLPGAIPVDLMRGPGLNKNVLDFENRSLDYIFSSHCLEHIENWENALAEWINRLKLNGIIFLYLPHPDCAIWHPGSPFVGDGHKWIPTPELLKETLKILDCEIIHFDDGPDAMQSFYLCCRNRS